MDSKTIVIKIGTSSLINELPDETTKLNLIAISSVVETCSKLMNLGHNVILVSSGAVGCGRHVMKKKDAPKTLANRQALAAIGQVHLMSKYENLFAALGGFCAQVLITYDTFRLREHYVNAENTIRELFKAGAIPIVNENDTVATPAIRSENDTMAAMVASMINADYLFLLTDVEGLYTSNPKADPSAKLINVIQNDVAFEQIASKLDLNGGSAWGSGGMSVKINAASLASSIGIQTTVLARKQIDYIFEIIKNPNDTHDFKTGTTFLAHKSPPNKRKRWIKGLRCCGTITVDSGAALALRKKHDIHAVGIKSVSGSFPRMAAVKVVDEHGADVATALVNYASEDIDTIKGLKLPEIEKCAFDFDGPVLYRKNIVVNNDVDSEEFVTTNTLLTQFES